MTQADRLCIKVALLPVAAYVLGLLGFMLFRHMAGTSPLPAGAAMVLLPVSVIVTIGAVGTANLLRIRLAGSPCE